MNSNNPLTSMKLIPENMRWRDMRQLYNSFTKRVELYQQIIAMRDAVIASAVKRAAIL